MVGYVTKKSDLGLPVPDQGQHLRPLTPECQCSLLGPHPLDFILPFVPCHSLSHRTETREHGAHHTSLYFWPELAPFPRLFHQGSKTRLPGLSAHSSSITQHPREESGRGPCKWWEVVTSPKGGASRGLSAMHGCPTRFGRSGCYQAVFPGCPRTHMFTGLVSESATAVSGLQGFPLV